MGKFWGFVRVVWQQTLAYRAEQLLWFVMESFPMIYMVSLWKGMAESGKVSQQFAGELAFYFLAALVITRLTANHFEEWLIDDIKDGTINKYLIQPFPIKMFLLANEATWRFFGTLFVIPLVAVMVPWILGFTTLDVGGISVGLTAIILIIAFFQRFYISFIIATCSFWLEQASALVHFKWMIEGVVGGSWLPLYFYPEWFQKVARLTPFYGWFFVPIQMLTNKLSVQEMVWAVFWAVGWLGTLAFFSNWLWKKGILKYSAVGG